MYFKLALKNITKSFKDYTIYFLTLIFSICMFYAFNSIQSQAILTHIDDAQKTAYRLISSGLGMASVFVAVILGFLIVYANNYLIKRRKKEFGIYMTLGMDNSKLSVILFCETIIIGIISLAVGLVLGVIASQFLSILTAKMFEVDLTKFNFVFSMGAFKKTILYFAIIYLIVLVFNAVVINKVKLINLINAKRKNETVKARNLWLCVIVFVISLVCIGRGYQIILGTGFAVLDTSIPKAIGLGIVGTFLLFFALTGFLLKVVKSRKNFYFKNLNMFVLRQINSKINTTFCSMAVICLLLFFSICTFSSGIGISAAINRDVKALSQYDCCISWYNAPYNLNDILKEKDINIEDYSDDYDVIVNYAADSSYMDFLDKNDKNVRDTCDNFGDADGPMRVIKLSSYNKMLQMLNKEPISLNDGEYALFADFGDIIKPLQKSMDKGTEVSVNGTKLKPSNIKVMNEVMYNAMLKMNIGVIIAPDSVVSDDMQIAESYIDLKYKNKDNDLKKRISAAFEQNTVAALEKEAVSKESIGIGAMSSYLAIYIGLIFIITSAAILALQQLSEADDNKDRYDILRDIGTPESLINKSVFVQIAIYFGMPLLVAAIHSVVGLQVAAKLLKMFGDSSILHYSFITVIVFVVVYGGYFIATYLCSRKMIQKSLD